MMPPPTAWSDWVAARGGVPTVGEPLAVRVDGAPRPQGSKRLVGRHMAETAAGLPEWRAAVARAARAAALAQRWTLATAGEPLAVVCRFAMPPGAVRGRRLVRAGTRAAWSATAPDADKLARALLDGITDSATVWSDDRLVAALAVVRVWAGTAADPTPGATFTVARLRE
jgi:Holliday junction resolvase RusA-like endonuclease